MQSFHFGDIELILAEPNQQVRNGLKSALRSQGFYRVTEVTRFRRLKEIVESEALTPDLIITDIELPGGDVCDLCYDIRHHKAGNDPFIPIIATSWSAGEDQVRGVIDSGADDLLIKPISTNNLLARITQLIKARKPFVVTTEYIGPDRRSGEQREGTEDIPTLEVPNKLQAKATGQENVSPEAFQAAVDKAAAVINERKMERHAHQLVYLAEHIVAPFHKGLAGDHLHEQVDRAAYVATDLARRMEGTRFSHVSELCASLLRVINSIRSAGDKPAIKDLDLLLELSRATEMAFSSDEKVVALAHDITNSVDSAVAG